MLETPGRGVKRRSKALDLTKGFDAGRDCPYNSASFRQAPYCLGDEYGIHGERTHVRRYPNRGQAVPRVRRFHH